MSFIGHKQKKKFTKFGFRGVFWFYWLSDQQKWFNSKTAQFLF